MTLLIALLAAGLAQDPSSPVEQTTPSADDPIDVVDLRARARGALAAGRAELAVQQLTTLLALTTDGPAYVLRAWAYNDLRRPDRALADLLEARLLGMDGSTWRREAAYAWLLSGDSAEANRLMPAPTTGRGHYVRGLIHEAFDQRVLARQDFTLAMKDPETGALATQARRRLDTAPHLLPDALDLSLDLAFGFQQNPGYGPDFSVVDGPDGYVRAGGVIAYTAAEDQTGHLSVHLGFDVQTHFVATFLTPASVFAGTTVHLEPRRGPAITIRPEIRAVVYQGSLLLADLDLPVQLTFDRAGRTDRVVAGLLGRVHTFPTILPDTSMTGGRLRAGYGATFDPGRTLVDVSAWADLDLTVGSARRHVAPHLRFAVHAPLAPRVTLSADWDTYGRFHLATDPADRSRRRTEWANEAGVGVGLALLPGQTLQAGYRLSQRLSNIPAVYSFDQHTAEVGWHVRM